MEYQDSWESFDFNNVLPYSYVVIDDYVTASAKSRKDFLSIINFDLRHKKIGMCIVLHQLVLSNLYSELLLAGHIFLTSSISSSHYVQKMKNMYSVMKHGYDYISNHDYHVLYINKTRNYAVVIKPNFIIDKMFSQSDEYVIHKPNENCVLGEEESEDSESLLNLTWFQDILDTYSTHKKKVLVLVQLLIKNKFLEDKDSLLIGNDNFHGNKLHLIDFFSICLSVNKVKLSKQNVQFFKTLFREATFQFPKSVFPLQIRKYMI